MEDAFGIIEQFESPKMHFSDSILSSRMRTFPIILNTTATYIHSLGKQELGFSGHRESIYGYENMAEVENVSEKCAENP